MDAVQIENDLSHYASSTMIMRSVRLTDYKYHEKIFFLYQAKKHSLADQFC
jgi:hypothetical protein